MTLTSIAAPTSVVAKVVRSNRSWWERVLQRETKRDECDTTLSDCRPQPTTTTSYYIYNIVSMNIKIRKLPSPKGPSVAAAVSFLLSLLILRLDSFGFFFSTAPSWYGAAFQRRRSPGKKNKKDGLLWAVCGQQQMRNTRKGPPPLWTFSPIYIEIPTFLFWCTGRAGWSPTTTYTVNNRLK